MEPMADVDEFLESYRAAFEQMDASAIAEHFAYPSHITGDADEPDLVPIHTKEAWVAEVERLLAGYRAIGVHSIRILRSVPEALSSRLHQVMVHWALHDRAGRSLYDFHAGYTLAKIGGALRITAITHNEAPKFRDLMIRLRAGTSSGTGR